MLNPGVKRLWIEALRSGRYQQGRRKLKDVRQRTFCCMGVLCEVAVEAGLKVDYSAHGYECSSVPTAVAEWAGFQYDGRKVFIGMHSLYLTQHNDGGATFAQIADAIEEQL